MFSRTNRLDERIIQLGGTGSSQGHALHFLERLRRADEDASRLALNLYHKPDALRFVLSWVKVPPNVSRAAISLSPEDNGPFIVTELDGKFVTCLGHQMGTDGLFLVTHDRLLALLDRYGDIEQGIVHAKQLKADDLLESCLRRLETAGMSYTCEDLDLIAPLQPLLIYDTFLEVVEGSRRVSLASHTLSRKHTKNKVDDETARLFWDEMFSVSHNLVLFGMNGTRGLEPILESAEHVEALWMALVATMWMNTFYHASRVIWLLGRLEGKLRRRYEQGLWQPETEMDWLLGLFGTAMSILKRETDEDSTVRMLERLHRKIYKYSPPVTGWITTYLEEEFFKRLIFVLTDKKIALEEYCIPQMQTSLFEHLHLVPDPSPYTFDKAEDISPMLALSDTMSNASEFMNNPQRLASLVTTLPAVVNIEAKDIYPPQSLADLLTPPWDKECTQIILDRETEMWKTPAAKTSKTVGRNALCPCGSGIKYKKCCLGKQNQSKR
jgi:hypothetical protein